MGLKSADGGRRFKSCLRHRERASFRKFGMGLFSFCCVESAMRHFRHTSLEMFQRYVKRLGVVKEKIWELKVELP